MYKEGDLVVVTNNINEGRVYHNFPIGQIVIVDIVYKRYCSLRSLDSSLHMNQSLYFSDFIPAATNNRQAVSLLSQED